MNSREFDARLSAAFSGGVAAVPFRVWRRGMLALPQEERTGEFRASSRAVADAIEADGGSDALRALMRLDMESCGDLEDCSRCAAIAEALSGFVDTVSEAEAVQMLMELLPLVGMDYKAEVEARGARYAGNAPPRRFGKPFGPPKFP